MMVLCLLLHSIGSIAHLRCLHELGGVNSMVLCLLFYCISHITHVLFV